MKKIHRTCENCFLAKTELNSFGFICSLTQETLHMPHATSLPCKIAITDEDILAARKEVNAKCVEKEPLTCSSGSFASWKDTDPIPFGNILSYYRPPEVIFHCSERNTGVPCTLEWCELHSKLNKDTESNLDEVSSLDNTIDECFREMKLLIEAGMNVGADLAREKSKTVYIFREPIDSYELETAKATIDKLVEQNKRLSKELAKSNRLLDEAVEKAINAASCDLDHVTYLSTIIDKKEGEISERKEANACLTLELETAKATIDKLIEESKASKELVANMEEAISNCLGPYGKKNMVFDDQLAALKICNEKLSKDNKELCDENKILQQEVALLKSKRKKDSGEIAFLQVKISQIKKELSGKWRLLDKEDSHPVRRKIII